MIEAICKLCDQKKDLCKSHIIPEFFYVPAYDKKHKAIELILDKNKKKPIQKGYREYLLCKDCEQKIGKYEKYVT